MKTWDDVIKDALAYLLHKEDYAYFYGAKGQVLTSSEMDRLWNAEPGYFSRYTEGQKKMIFDWSRGKVGLDCSGFIYKVTGCALYSGAIIDRCTDKSEDISAGPAGSILWKPGHVGLDVGYGYFLHFPAEMHSCEIGRIREGSVAWEKTGLLSSYINYKGADAR